MTNAEKFKEVFGFEPDPDVENEFCIFTETDCEKMGVQDCDDCPNNDWWDHEYKEPEK